MVEQAGQVPDLLDVVDRAGVAPGAPAPLVAAGVDFVLEGLYAQKRISRTDERGYHGAEPARRLAARPGPRNPVPLPRRRGGGTGPRRRAQEAEALQLTAAAGGGEGVMRYRYTKYAPNLFDDLDIDELTAKLSDLLLASGFGDGMGGPFDGADRTMQALHDAILEALFNGGVLPPDLFEQLFGRRPTARVRRRRSRSKSWRS